MRYYIIAGEASGDLHASNLMRGLLAHDPACDIRFWGGEAMAAVGGTKVRDYRDTAVMGFGAVLGKARQILDRLAFCKRDIQEWNPDAVILVDYPEFNLRVARFAKERGFKVFWYIAPKVWAHRAGRVKQLRRSVDVLYSILPFEPAWFRSHGIEPRYFGNPLIDSVAQDECKPVGEGKLIALLAGSRPFELKFLMPRFVELERLLDADPRMAGYRLVVACAPSLEREQYQRFLPEGSRIELLPGRTRDILRQAEAAVISSGTASLEAALAGTPQVVCYGADALSYNLARLTVHVRFISLANLVLDRAIFSELVQEQATPERIKAELERLLFDEACRAQLAADYLELKNKLGGTGASDRVAKDMIDETARL